MLAAYIMVNASRAHQQEITQKLHSGLAQFVVDHYLLFQGGEPDLVVAEHTFHDLMLLGPNFEFYILNAEGKILAFSADPSKVVKDSVDLTQVKNYLAHAGALAPLYGEDPRHEGRSKVFSAAAIQTEEGLQGYLYVILGSEIYDTIAEQVLDSKILRWSLCLGLLGLLFSFCVALILTGFITRPLSALTFRVEGLLERGFDNAYLKQWLDDRANQSKQKQTTKEIRALDGAFATLLVKLSEQYDKVINVDELRRELISHISHDLRTPLASLLGYLETWQINHATLSEKDSVQYIATAQKNAHKIYHLIEQLFELAHLDSGDVKVTFEKFSVAELAQDVLQKFVIAAKEKGVTMFVSPQDTCLRVVGDIEKLERVLTNLVENALRHTDQGGKITIRLSQRGRFVAVEVSDTGIGIPPADIGKIFDAHFKAGNSVRGNTAHGGLGLAITKKLLALHQAQIDVKSKTGTGTTFQFNLPVAV